jgi:hypothetical protein
MRRAYCEIVTGVRALVAIVAAIAFPAVASADPLHGASWDEIGVLRARVDMDNGQVVDGVAVRFAPRVPITHDLYIGGELDTGTLSGQISQSAAFRTTGGEQGPMEAVTGKFGAVRAVIGARVRFGIVSAAGEFALGVHAADLRDQWGTPISGVQSDDVMMEGRARVDLWMTPRLTLGAIAGVDLADSRNSTAGLMFGYHFGNFDGMH